MTIDDIRLLKYGYVGAKRFGYWVHFRDRRNLTGIKARKSLIKFFDSCFGSLGDKWQYTKTSADEYIIKVEDEKNLLIFLMKLK